MDHPIGECVGCRDLAGCRLGLGPVEVDHTFEPKATAVCPPEFEGGLSTAHGGWVAAVLDDFLGQSMKLAGQLSVTAELDVRYLRPVPVGPVLLLNGHVVSRDGERWRIGAELRSEDGQKVLATAEGLWIERGPEHWERHMRELAGDRT